MLHCITTAYKAIWEIANNKNPVEWRPVTVKGEEGTVHMEEAKDSIKPTTVPNENNQQRIIIQQVE